MYKREKISTFYKDEFLRVYEIIVDDSIEDKLAEILKVGPLIKLERSLRNPYISYKEIDNEIKTVKDWYENYKNEKKKPKKPQLNQFSPETVSRKLFELVYLNELIENSALNENTYYPIFKIIAPSLVARDPQYKYLFNTPNLEMFNTEQVKKAQANVDLIEQEIKKFHHGDILKNLKYRRSIEEFLENNNYLDNYRYAEYILNVFINTNAIYRDSKFVKCANIDLDRLDECARIVKFLNPVLYEQYMEKRKYNDAKNLNAVNHQFIKLANKIREYRKNGSDMPVYEFLTNAPLIHYTYTTKDFYYNYNDKFTNFCNEPTVKQVIKDYLFRNKIGYLYYVNIYSYMKSLTTIDGMELTDEDKENIIYIMKKFDICPIVRMINLVIHRYLNNEYNMSELQYKKDYNPIEEVINQNPYTYTLSKNAGK